MTISIRDYFAAAGSRFTKDDAAIIGPVLQELAASGQATVNSIVEVAKSANSPLHRYFEWDDKKAAHQYRLGQADDMARSIRVRLVGGNDQPANQRIVVQVTSDIVPRAAPRPIPVQSGEDGQKRRLAEAMNDLDRWLLTYRPYTALWPQFGHIFEPVCAAIEAARNRHKAPDADSVPPHKISTLPEVRPTYKPFNPLELPRQLPPAVMRAARNLAEKRGVPCQVVGDRFKIGDQVMTAEQVLADTGAG